MTDNLKKQLLSVDSLCDLYIDFALHFTSVKAFAKWHGLNINVAGALVDASRKHYHKLAN